MESIKKVRANFILKHYCIEDVADILGYYDESNPEIIEHVTADEGTIEWESQLLDMAIGNGNFDHVWIIEARDVLSKLMEHGLADYLPPSLIYLELLQIVGATDENRKRYGKFTIKQWNELLYNI